MCLSVWCAVPSCCGSCTINTQPCPQTSATGSITHRCEPLQFSAGRGIITVTDREVAQGFSVFAFICKRGAGAMKQPLIGIVPLVDAARESYWMLPGYMRGVEQAGGVPVMLPLTDDAAVLQKLADRRPASDRRAGCLPCPIRCRTNTAVRQDLPGARPDGGTAAGQDAGAG